MKRLFFLLALLLNLGPCFQDGKLSLTSGSLMAQSMGDESTCHLICSATVIISGPCESVFSIPCPGVTITSPPYEPPTTPEPPTMPEPPTYNPCQTSFADACACFNYCSGPSPPASPPATPPTTTPKTPPRVDCSGTQADIASITTTVTQNNPAWAKAISTIKSNLNNPATQNEFGIALHASGSPPTYLANDEPTPGEAMSVSTPTLSCTTSGGMYSLAKLHSHPKSASPNTFNFSPPSAGDVYSLAAANGRCTRMVDSYTVAYNGDEYVLHVTNPATTAAFLAANPRETNVDRTGGFNPTSPIGKDFAKAELNFRNQGYSVNDADGMATAYVLSSNNAGITLLKKDSDGQFKQLTVTVTTSGGNTTFTITMCK